MKQTTLYYVLAICLIIISVLLTILVMSKQNTDNKYTTNKENINIMVKPDNSRYYNDVYDVYGEYDRYDSRYDSIHGPSFWYQPRRWWNHWWNGRQTNIYPNNQTHNQIHNYNYKHDKHNRDTPKHIITEQPHSQPQASHFTGRLAGESKQLEDSHYLESNFKIPIDERQMQGQHSSINLIKPEAGSLFPFPTLSASSNIMPEDISMSPMTHMDDNLKSIQSRSNFISDVSAEVSSNFTYAGPDPRNHKPMPVDIMASESIGLQPNTVANQIIQPNVPMEH